MTGKDISLKYHLLDLLRSNKVKYLYLFTLVKVHYVKAARAFSFHPKVYANMAFCRLVFLPNDVVWYA